MRHHEGSSFHPLLTQQCLPVIMQGMKKRGKPANIWDVVSSLAQALTDARDQLVGLINSDRNSKRHKNTRFNRKQNTTNALAMRLRGGETSHYVPSNQKVRSVHRQHVRGPVAFGNHSDFKPAPPGKPETMALNWSCRPGSGKGGAQTYLDANSLKMNKKKGRPESPVSIIIPKSPESAYQKESRCRSPYDCKRHCIGTQYAELLREEACRARERRLAKTCERMHGKPRWARC